MQRVPQQEVGERIGPVIVCHECELIDGAYCDIIDLRFASDETKRGVFDVLSSGVPHEDVELELEIFGAGVVVTRGGALGEDGCPFIEDIEEAIGDVRLVFPSRN